MLVITLYKFVKLLDYLQLRAPLLSCCEEHQVKGTILLAREGINGTIAGAESNVRAVLNFIRQDPRLVDIEYKESHTEEFPFYRMKVRLKQEIVTMGVPELDPTSQAGDYVGAQEWNELILDPDVLVIDVRNDYEVLMGSFKGAINPCTKTFREMPQWLRDNEQLKQKPKVAMFCTGGIRCEKSTAFLKSQGFDEVYHLKGGILKYLETVPQEDSLWEGECFVFDERVSVKHQLELGSYELCRACRYPISSEDKRSEHYVEGISCSRCYDQTTDEQKAGFAERQRQMELAKTRQQRHIGQYFQQTCDEKDELFEADA